MTVQTWGEAETWQAAKAMGARARPGQVYALVGDLGVGKTVFAKGFAEGLGILDPVSSPTFTIAQVYEGGRLPFYHFDVYRIQDPEELDEIGFGECLSQDGVCLVEWADLVADALPPETIWVSIEKDLEKGFDYRRLQVRTMGDA